jgi:hypothetical protein
MKKLITLLFILGFLNVSYGEGDFAVGTNVGSVGIGLGSSLGVYTGSTATPAISLQFEHGMWQVGGPGVISLGGYVGFKSYKYTWGYGDYESKWNYTIIGLRSAYHYTGPEIKDFDLYGGAMLSYNNVSYSDNYIYHNYLGSYSSYVSLTLYVGGRYYFTKNIAAFAELGYGIAYLNIGASFRL